MSEAHSPARDVEIVYRFRLGDGSERAFVIRLDPVRFPIRREAPSMAPPWTDLADQQCAHCSLDPAALNDLSALAQLAIGSDSLARLRETFFAHR